MTIYPTTELPAPQGAFPEVAPAPFPVVTPAPTFGMTYGEQAVASSSPYTVGLLGSPTPYAATGSVAQASYGASMGLLASLTGGAVGAGNDPRRWTPEEAGAQTDKALARIGAVNPELAQALAEQQGRAAQPEGGGGFFDTLMGGVGTLLEVTHLDDVLEVLSRPAKVLPEVIMDWGEEDVWKNVGDAMFGHSDVSWDDVLVEKFGMERNFFTAAVGLVGDIALDPLTYIPLGRLASLGREVTSQAAAKAVFTAGIKEVADEPIQAALKMAARGEAPGLTSDALRRAADIDAFTQYAFAQGAESLDEVAAVGFNTSDVGKMAAEKVAESQKKLLGRLHARLQGTDPDAAAGFLDLGAQSMVKNGLKRLTQDADAAFELAYRGDFTKGARLLAEKQGWSYKHAEATLKQWVREGTQLGGGAATKGLYTRGRVAATQLGGWRFHLNIPVLGVRIAPVRVLPRMNMLGNVAADLMPNFSVLRRWTSGIAGEMRLERMVARGTAGATMRDLTIFTRGGAKGQGGFSALRAASPGVARHLAGNRFARVGEVYLSASESVGKLTAHFAPHAAALRKGGLGGLRSSQLTRMMPGIQRGFISQMETVDMGDGRILTGAAAEEALFKAVAPVFKLGDEAGAELSSNLQRWSSLWPPEAQGRSVDELLKSLPTGTMSPEAIEEARRLYAYFAGIEGGAGAEAAHIARRQAHQIEDVGAANGVSPRYARDGYDGMDDMHPDDAVRATSESQYAWARDSVYEPAGDGLWTQDEMLGDALEDVATTGATARGQHLKLKRIGITATSPDTRALRRAQLQVRQAEAELRELTASPEGGGVAVLTDPDAFLAAEEKLAVARAAVEEGTGRSRELVAYPKNVVEVDLRTSAKAATDATDAGPVNLAGEAEERVRRVADAMNQRADTVDEIAEEAMAPELKSIADELRKSGGQVPAAVTRDLQREGKDGIRILTDEGEELIIFRHPKTGDLPISRLDRGARRVGMGGGVNVRSATEDAYAAIRKSQVKDLPGGTKMWLEGKLRETAGLTDEAAERELQAAFAEAGVKIDGSILEKDFLRSLSKAREAQARRIGGQLVGNAGRRLESLGLTSSIGNGGLVGLDKMRYTLPEKSLEKLDYQIEQVKAAAERNSILQRRDFAALELEAQVASENIALHHAAADDIIDALDVPTYRSIEATRVVDHVEDVDADILDQARIRGDAQDLGDGLFLVSDESGGYTIFSTRAMGQEPLDGFDVPPLGSTPLKEGFVRVYHEAPRKAVKSIRSKGVATSKLSEAGQAAFVFTDTKQILRRMRGGPTGVPAENVIVEAQVPASKLRGIEVVGGIEPGELQGFHTPGREVVTGYRHVNADGTVDAVADATQGVRNRLVREHWQLEGVFDAPDPVVAAADVIRRQGVTSAAEKKVALGTRAGVNEVQVNIENKLSQQIADSHRALSQARLEEQNAIAEVQRLSTRLQTEASETIPALVAADDRALSMVGMDRLEGIPGFETLAMPSVMAKEFQRAVEGFKGLDGIHADFRKFNSWWKSHATWMWPGFHVRNMYGAFFNNMLGGVNIRDYVLTGRIRRAERALSTGVPNGGKWGNKLLREGGDGEVIDALRREGNFVLNGKAVEDLTYGDLAEMASTMGLTSGNSRAFESRLLGETTSARRPGEGQTLLERRAGPYAKLAKGAGSMTENVMRTAAFVRGLKSYGGPIEARAFAMVRHGDYSDLTDFEYGVVRDLIPFYKWMRTNTPFQVHQLLESPGKLLAVQKAQGAAFTAQGMDYDEERYKMPGWMGESFIIPTSGPDDQGAYESIMFDLPMADVHMGVRDVLSAGLPFLRPFLESYVLDQSIFTGAPIDGEPVPLAGVFSMPGIKQLLEVTQLADEGAGGKMYTTDKIKNLLGIIPEFSRAREWITADPDRAGLRWRSFFSAAFGVTPRPVDAEAMVAAEMDYYYGTILPSMEHLKAQGFPLPTTADIEATLGDVDTALISMGITPREEAA